jgi:F-type H+-transporting ATPase subunit b
MGINLWNFVSQLFTFLVLVLVLAKWAFPALMKTLDSRERVISEGVANSEKARRELAEAQKRVESLLDQARRDAQASLAKATQAAEQVRVEIERDAQTRARDIITQAEKRIQQEIAQARAQLRQEVADLAIQAAEHVTGSSLDTTTNRRLVSEFVAQSRDMRDVQC